MYQLDTFISFTGADECEMHIWFVAPACAVKGLPVFGMQVSLTEGRDLQIVGCHSQNVGQPSRQEEVTEI